MQFYKPRKPVPAGTRSCARQLLRYWLCGKVHQLMS